MMRRAHFLFALAACGDNGTVQGTFEVVGHDYLGARGMNAALAIAGDTAYIGSRIDNKSVLIVDIADPTAPRVVGEIGPPVEGLAGMSSRELRATIEPPLLTILNLQCSPSLHGCGMVASEVENLKVFDIAAPRAPVLLGTHNVTGNPREGARSPHEFFLWSDPVDRERALVLLAAPGIPSLEIINIQGGMPALVLAYDPYTGGVTRGGEDNILHSVSTSDDGRTLYLSHQTAGLYVADISTVIDKAEMPMVMMQTPAATALRFGAMGPHSAVPVPGRPGLLLTTEEVYPAPFGAGCPWGHVRMVDAVDPTQPKLLGEYKLPENDPACTADGPMVAFTAHNATATENIALVSWYAGGLQAIDISDPSAPVQLAEFRPDPLDAVSVEDPGLGGSKVEMWSYPIIKDGLIYVVDSRNGLYVLRYHGRFGEELDQRQFLEGNSNVGAYLARE